MGGKQSKTVKKSFSDRIRRIGTKNRVVPICSQNLETNRSTVTPVTRPASLNMAGRGIPMEDIVIEDLEDVPTDALYEEDVFEEDVDDAIFSVPSHSTFKKRIESVEDLDVPVACPVVLDDLVIEDLEDIPTAAIYDLGAAVPDLGARVPDGAVSPWSEDKLRAYRLSRAKVLHWKTLCDFSEFPSFIEDPSDDEDLTVPIPRARRAGLDYYASLLRQPRKRLTYCDSLTNVTSLDTMSVDSELISILRDLEGRGKEITDELLSPSPQPSGIGLEELQVMFTVKEEECKDGKIPDYILFMSLPSVNDMYY